MPRVRVKDVELFYLEIDNTHSDAAETLIFLPGGAGMVDHSLYKEYWAQFSDKLKVIFIDPRGCGLSDDGDNPLLWKIRNQTRDLKAFCDILGLDKPIIAGVSWGGYIALSYAALFPDSVGGLILCNTESKINSKYRKEKFLERGGEKAARAVEALDSVWSWKVNQEYLEQCLPFYALKNPYTLDELERAGRKNRDLYQQFFTDEHPVLNITGIEKIKCPVLQLAGTEDPVHPVKSARETFEKFSPGIAILKEFDAGDTVYRDQPDVVAETIRNFLMQHILLSKNSCIFKS